MYVPTKKAVGDKLALGKTNTVLGVVGSFYISR